MRIERIAPQLVELAPSSLEPGVLYISRKYQLALHLCCCGCGEKVVTPLSPAEWRLRLVKGAATLSPSIGNWSMACRSHYWIRDNRVVWSGPLSQRAINAVHRRDHGAIDAMHRARATQARGTSTGPVRDVGPVSVGWLIPQWLLKFVRWLLGK